MQWVMRKIGVGVESAVDFKRVDGGCDGLFAKMIGGGGGGGFGGDGGGGGGGSGGGGGGGGGVCVCVCVWCGGGGGVVVVHSGYGVYIG